MPSKLGRGQACSAGIAGHNLIHLLRKPHVIGVHRDHVLPACIRAGQGSLNIAEGLTDLIRERLRKMPIIIPSALA